MQGTCRAVSGASAAGGWAQLCAPDSAPRLGAPRSGYPGIPLLATVSAFLVPAVLWFGFHHLLLPKAPRRLLMFACMALAPRL